MPSPVLCGERWRTSALERLRREPFDLLVIGGGITGAGIARDAALRGLRTALIERDDHLPPYAELQAEADRARQILNVYGDTVDAHEQAI